MDTYDLEPQPRNTGLIVSGIVVIVIALIGAAVIIYKHDHPTVVTKIRPSAETAVADAQRAKELTLLWAEISGVVIVSSFQVYLMIWVARDCRNRSDDAGALWAFVVFLIPLIGLLVYLSSRPKGFLEQCRHCPNKRLPYVASCPHCGRS